MKQHGRHTALRCTNALKHGNKRKSVKNRQENMLFDQKNKGKSENWLKWGGEIKTNREDGIINSRDLAGRFSQSRLLIRAGVSTVLREVVIDEVKTKRQNIFPFSEITSQNNGNMSTFEREQSRTLAFSCDRNNNYYF